jgi:hypothetical protein
LVASQHHQWCVRRFGRARLLPSRTAETTAPQECRPPRFSASAHNRTWERFVCERPDHLRCMISLNCALTATYRKM